MKAKAALLIFPCISFFFITGCWDYREVDKIPIVVGMAVDMDNEGRHVITAEIVDLEQSGKESSLKSKFIEASGESLFEAIRNAIKYDSGRLYFGHMEAVIISKRAAENGVAGIVDFLTRDVEPRLNIDLFVSKGKTAAEILTAESITYEIRSFEIQQMNKGQKQLSKSFEMRIVEFVNLIQNEGFYPVMPCVHTDMTAGQKTQSMGGTAIFRKDKLIGFLSDDETFYFCFVTDRVEGGIITLENAEDPLRKDTSLEILNSTTSIKPVLSDGKISIDIEIKTSTSLAEHGATVHSQLEGAIMHKREAENLIKKNISALIARVQKDYGTDIFGFGDSVHKEMPDVWKKVKKDWNDIFREITVNVQPEVEIKESGLIQRPIHMEG